MLQEYWLDLFETVLAWTTPLPGVNVCCWTLWKSMEALCTAHVFVGHGAQRHLLYAGIFGHPLVSSTHVGYGFSGLRKFQVKTSSIQFIPTATSGGPR